MKRKLSLGALLLALAGVLSLPQTARAAAPDVGEAAIALSGYNWSGAELTNFPMLVRLSSENFTGIDMSTFAADGSDIRFYDANGTPIPHEIDEWHPDGESLIWVRVPVVSNATTAVTMNWGNTSGALPSDPVWDDKYRDVYHMRDTSDVKTVTDLSGGGTTDAIEGAVGRALSHTDTLTVANTTTALGDSYSISCWYKGVNIKADTTTANLGRYFLKKGDWSGGAKGWYLEHQVLTEFALIAGSGSSYGGFPHIASPNPNEYWIHVSVVRVGTTVTVYCNGDAASASVTHANVSNESVYNLEFASGHNAPNEYFHHDECRVRTDAVSADWVKADYLTQKKDGNFSTCTLVQNAASRVTLDWCGGIGGDASVLATYDKELPAIVPPSCPGYVFNGYFDAASGGTQYYNANGTGVKTWDKEKGATLYAQWTAGVVGDVTTNAIPGHADWGYVIQGGSLGYDTVYVYTNQNDSTMTWTVPTGVSTFRAFVVAGGGAGGAIASTPVNFGGGGGGGGVVDAIIDKGFSSGTSFNIKVGAGGASAETNGGNSYIKDSTTTVIESVGGGAGMEPPGHGATEGKAGNAGGSGGGAGGAAKLNATANGGGVLSATVRRCPKITFTLSRG